ncbi:hypothetical protein OG978_15845 [Streptomyces sp. NBC_01591]|uniref:hypothetical protein n=1 Tax=Streptomyces sp. NBC_01591 TaxID=2975888 RepID=UPI002DD9E52D|nr:hypothetical protein [Streptomyces sp. NBC_01591]WSD68744.1 hypothetical protein OG978_15845 [Streptomyces sp. NBC_01591]
MLNYEDVIDAPIGKLKTAADDWSDMAGRLDTLAVDATNGMKAKADKAEWEGVNAGVTKAFIGKTANEFKDAAAEAKGVKQILAEAYTAFKKAKDDLTNIRDQEGPAAGIHVDAKGKVTARNPISENNAARHDPDFATYLRQERENIEAWQKKIDAIVDNCNDTDVSFRNTLAANISDSKDFSAPKYQNMDQEEAHRAAAYAAKGREITHAELVAMNEILRDNKNSVEFSKTFYETLGPEKSLAFFGQLSTDTQEYGKVDKERLADVQALQKNLGFNLAKASHDKDFSADWGPELRKLGTERIPLAKYDNNAPFGYQLLGGIMRYGNYDAKFLNPIAEHVMQVHQKEPDLFYGSKSNGLDKSPFNPSGINGAGYDPVVSMLESLGHSPQAAKEFFSADPTAYNMDGTDNSGATAGLGKDKDDNNITSYLDFFQNEEYEPFYDVPGHDPDEAAKTTKFLPDALGKALESATTGHAWDDPTPTLKRDETTAAIMKEVIDSYGTDSDLLDRHESLKDSLGRMGAAYIDDLNYSTYNFGSAGDELGRDSLFANSSDGSQRTDFGEAASRRFMGVVAADDEGWKSLSSAQQMYEASGLKAFGAEHQEAALIFGSHGAKVHGIIDESRIEGIHQQFKGDEEAKNLEMEKNAEWRKFGVSSGVGAVVGVGTAVVLGPAAGVVAATAVPLVMDTVSSAIDTGYAGDTLEYLKDKEYSNDDEALTGIDRFKNEGERGAVTPLLNYADEVGMSDYEKQQLAVDIETSYGNGKTAAGDQGRVKS